METTFLGTEHLEGCLAESNKWSCNLTYVNRTENFIYYNESEVSVDDLIRCLLIDHEACTMSFVEWCGQFGLDTDSRKDLENYLNTQENGDKLLRLFGDSVLELSQFED